MKRHVLIQRYFDYLFTRNKY